MENIPNKYIFDYIDYIYLKIFILYHNYLTHFGNELGEELKKEIKKIYQKRLSNFAQFNINRGDIYFIDKIKKECNLQENNMLSLEQINNLYNETILELFRQYDNLKTIPNRLYEKIEDELKIYSLLNPNKNIDLYFNNYHLIISSKDYFKTKIRNYEITEDKETSRLNIYYFIAVSLIISFSCLFITLFK